MANNNTLNRIKEISLALAGKINHSGRCRHFSFLVDKNRIVSIGWNKYNKTHPITKKYGYPNYHTGIHSELAAILKNGQKNCAGLTIINTRINGNNEFDNAAPCKYCSSTISLMCIKEIIYTGKDGEWINK